jgi:hypothetical protein
VTRAVVELRDYFVRIIQYRYQRTIDLFRHMKHEQSYCLTNQSTLDAFIERLHRREIRDGLVRRTLYDMIYDIASITSTSSPIVYKIVVNSIGSHRTIKSSGQADFIVHCRCGSVYDENSLVQCYACQVSIECEQ